ncbi:MAG: Histone acetyltransferase type B subunit 2 [Vezdaea aestivalis]|nr:MAG: Histone acetyltransferase type B subunit 2 [Vezdaea aestivalis]
MEDDILMPSDEVDEAVAAANKVINEEYKIWKKNAPYLYDLMLSTALEWPTLTTQWFPDKQSNPENPYSVQRLLLGTHTSSEAPNYLQIAEVKLPNRPALDPYDYDEEKEEIGGYGTSANGNPANGNASKGPAKISLEIIQKIDHPGEVNKARYMPQNPNLIATMCNDGQVLIFDRTKHSSVPNGVVSPQMRLIGHRMEGFALAWSPHNEGYLASGSEDQTVRIWDTTKYTKQSKNMKATETYTHHDSIVNDVQYHPSHPSILGSVSDDLTLQIIDTRDKDPSKARIKTVAHADAVNALSFNAASDVIIATASADCTLGVWDLRNLKEKLHALEAHRDTVTAVAWHPFDTSILASSSRDRRVLFWDLSRIGDEQSQEDSEDGPPELLFMHGGHTNAISDFSWNPNDPWVMCSAAEDNLVQVWQTSREIVAKDSEDVEQEELDV